MDRGAWQATVHGITGVGHDLANKPPPQYHDGFCHRYTCVPSLLNPTPYLPPHSTPLRCHRAPALGSLLHTQSPTGYLFYIRNIQALILKRLLWLLQGDAAAGENLAKCLTLRMWILINWPESSWVKRCLERQGRGPRGPPYLPGQWPC